MNLKIFEKDYTAYRIAVRNGKRILIKIEVE